MVKLIFEYIVLNLKKLTTYKSLVFILINFVEKILFNNFRSFNESISKRSLSNLSVIN